MAKPVSLPEWGTATGADIVEPALGQKQDGWDVNDRPPAGWLNWWQNLVFDWTEWIDSKFDDGTGGDRVACYGVDSTAAISGGVGVIGTGLDNGIGVRGNGGTTSGTGIRGFGGAPNGRGGSFTGSGVGPGVVAVGAGQPTTGYEDYAGLYAYGATGQDGPGVVGLATDDGAGVIGRGSGATGAGTASSGVFGKGGGSNGYGVEGEGVGNGAGIVGKGPGGVAAPTIGTGTYGIGGTNGIGVEGRGGSGDGFGGVFVGSGNGTGVKGTGGSAGPGVHGVALGADYGVIAESDTSSPGRAALRIIPQDTNPTTGAVGDLYVNSGDQKLYLCTNAVGPVWTVVGTQA